MYKLAILLVFLIPYFATSQVDIKFGRTNSDTLPERFQINTPELREHIYSGIPEDLRNNSFPRSTFRFADQASIQLSYLFSSGRVYNDWPSLEEYLNDILKKVMPEELAKDSLIHVYLLKNGRFNAFMTPAGMIFMNIGVFDDVKDEATLAGILTHELAHYYLKHSIAEYVKQERGDFKPGFLLSNKGAHSRFSVQNELDADSLAMVWLHDSGYHLDGLIQSFSIMERLEENWLSRQKDTWEVEETTHPLSEKRLEKLEAYKETLSDQAGSHFQINKQQFFKFRESIKPEILKTLLHNFAYFTCIEKAFKFHLFDPNNSVLHLLSDGSD